MTTKSMSLAEALPHEIKRLREEVIPAYRSIGTPGNFAVAMMEFRITQAEEAIAQGDVVAMLRLYSELKDYKT